MAGKRYAQAGYLAPDGKSRLRAVRGIEIGNIFKLGTKFSQSMGCTYLDEAGKQQIPTMGCYGIGVGRLMAAAIENDNSTSPTTSQRVVLLSGTIQEGTFSLSCPGSLHENYAYPSWALFADVDGNGKCSAGDVGYQAQLFGWNGDVEQALLAADASAVTSLPAPIGSGASSFCSGYFE